jgi:pSer/pThr/pTyr-binding forkhead associated (FHA) protein
MASLFVIEGKARGNYYVLEEGTVRVGRDEHTDIQIVDDMVSRSHLDVSYDRRRDACRIADLKSANGSFVNGRRITGEVELADGDTIRIGQTTLLYTVKNISDLDTAMAVIKKRGEHGKGTLIQ